MAIIYDNNTPIFNGLSSLYTNVVLSGGNVGIGTSTPNSLLAVGNAATRGTVTVNGSTASAPFLQLLDNQGSGRAFALYSGRVASTFTLEDTTGSNLVRLAIDSGGRVGFGGQTAPGYTVDVTGSINFTGNIYQNGVIYGGGGGGGGAAGGLYVPLSGTNGGAMYGPLSSTNTAFFSSIGIGTPTPNVKLHVYENTEDWAVRIQNVSTGISAAKGLVVQAGDSALTTPMIMQLRDKDATAKVTFLSQGNVGIGTASPNAKLQIVTPVTASVPAAGTYGGAAIFSNDLTTYGLYVGSISNGNGYIQQQRGDTATTYNLLLQPNGGSIGINTTSPGAKLDVRGTLLAGTAGSSTRSSDGVTIDIDYNTAYSANSDAGDSGRFLSIVNESTSNNRFAQLGFRVNPNGGSNNAMLDFKFVNTQSYTSKLVASYLGSGGSWFDRQVYYSTGKVEFSGDLFFPLAGIGGNTTNLTTSQGWVVANPTTGAQTGYFDSTDPSFQINGSNSENKLTWALTPYSSPGLTWASINDASSDADGGWNKYVSGVSSAKSYRSLVWVRRTNASTNGSFYFGCDGGNTLNLDNTANGNPYFFATGISTLATTNRWYLVVGYIHAYADGSTTNYSKMYDSVTGQVVAGGTDYKMANGATRQMHRTYLYYSTDTNANLEWWGPRFEEINGNEPAISGMLFELITSPTFTGSVTTPIVYDYNDTTYYVDPNGTTNIKYLKLNTDGTSSATRALTIRNVGLAESNYGSYPGAWTSALQIQNNDNTKMLWMSPLDSSNYAAISVNGTNAGINFNVNGAYNAAGNLALQLQTDTSVYAPSNFRSPIFYDSDNTGYYVNPAGTSNLNIVGATGRIWAGWDAGDNNSVSCSNWFRSNGSTGWFNASYGGGIHMQDSTYVRVYNNKEFYNQNNFVTDNAVYSPIYYDRNDTGYYLDPNSTSDSALRIRGGALHGPNTSWGAYLWVGSNGRPNSWASVVTTNGNLHLDCQNGYTLFLNYYSGNSVQSYIIYSIADTSYYINMNSTSRLLYVTMPHRGNGVENITVNTGAAENYNAINIASGSGTFGIGKSDTSHSYWGRTNMSFHIGSGDGWRVHSDGWDTLVDVTGASGNMYVKGQIRTPIYYDSNDTTYYIDPNSESNWQGLTLRGKAQTGLTGKSNWKRPDITGDSNYWVGTMGWGGTTPNDMMLWGSGFTDSWGSSGYPGDTSHYLGIQTYHYVNGSNSGYGWQMLGGVTDSLWWRHSWPNNSGWFKVAMYNNNASVGDFYAAIVYDTNNTGYYCDPASTSNMNVINAQGRVNVAEYLYSTNGCGRIYLPGNLHIDAFCGHSIYLNQASGAYIRFFGPSEYNGNSVYGINQLHSQIFYDANNTGYYVDPASTSNMNVINAQGRVNVAEYLYSTNGCGRIYLPGNLHIDAFCGHSIYLNYYSNAWIRHFYHNEHNGYDIYGVNRLDIQIIYDANNTGYYINPNGTSYVNSFITNDWFRVDGAGGLVFSTYGYGIYSAHSGGSNYGNVSTFGTGRSGWSGYSIGRWSWMSNYGDYIGLHDQNRTWMYYWDGGNHRWNYGSAIFQGMPVQANIFYDYENTGYYCDPNNQSRLNNMIIDWIYLAGNTGNYITEGWGTRLGSAGGQWPCKVQNSLVVGGLGWDGTDFGGGNIFATGSINQYWSDGRLKKNVEVISDALDKVMRLRGVTFEPDIEKAKELGANPCQISQGREAGLIAQEVQAVLPEVVRIAPFDINDGRNGIFESKSGDNYLTLQYERIVGLLVEAIKELNHKVDNLKEEVKTLKGG